MIKFSFIMAAYNAEKYISEAISSVLNQSYDTWELIIVDDGSTDNTPVLIDCFSNKDSRIRVIHQANSGTAAAARNTALKHVSGDYVQMIDADDLLNENMLTEYEKKLKVNDFDIVIPNAICFENDDMDNIFWEKDAPDKNYDQVLTGKRGFELSLDWTVHGFFLVKNELIQRIKYDPKLLNGDEFTTRKLLFNADRIGFSDTYYYYRKNPDSTTKSSKNKYRMYECVITDINIYNFSIDNHMSQEIVDKCINKLIQSFFHYSNSFSKDEKLDDDIEGRNYAGEILQRTYYMLTKDMFNCTPFKYRLFYYISGGKYRRFKAMIEYVSKFRK